MIADATFTPMPRARTTETFVGAYVALALAVALALSGRPAAIATALAALWPAPVTCGIRGQTPEQVVYRYFELGAGARATDCWSTGRGPKSLSERASHAFDAEPISFVVHNVRRGSTETDEFASVLVTSHWGGTAPTLWSGDAPRWISLRLQADGRWMIEAVDVEPLVRERSD